MAGEYFTCPQCGKGTTVKKIIKNNYACLNPDCELNVRMLIHGEVSATGQVSKIYGWVQEPGTILKKKYKIMKMIGKGGYGATYIAHDHSLFQQQRAIKETPRVYCDDKEDEFLTFLNHPAIPKLYERFNIKKFHYSVMELIEGISLDDVVKRNGRGLPENKVLEYAGQLCDVLRYIHSRKVVHRDLKPENILIRKNSAIALIDFGISKQLISGQGTRHLARAASYSYSSPEQYQTGRGGTDFKSDIYSFGAILYFLATGIEPLDALSRQATQNISPLPRDLNGDISPKLEQVIVKAMKMNKSERFASISQMKEALFGNGKSTAKKICPACKTLIEPENNFCPNCGSSTKPIEQNFAHPFIFRSQKKARNLTELVQICYEDWDDGIWHLYQGDFEKWLAADSNYKSLVKKAIDVRKNQSDQHLGLNDFLLSTGFGESPSLSTRQTAFHPGTIVKGNLKNLVLTINNNGQGCLTGSLRTNASWIVINQASFSCLKNKSSRLVVTIDTSKLQPKRKYEAVLLIESNGGNMKIPVSFVVAVAEQQLNPLARPITLVVPKGEKTTKELYIPRQTSNGHKIDTILSLSNWLKVKSKKNIIGKQRLLLTVSTKKMKIGKYRGRILIQTGKIKQYIDVVLNVTNLNRMKKPSFFGHIFFFLMFVLIIRYLGPNAEIAVSQPYIIASMGLILGFANRHNGKARFILGLVMGVIIGAGMNLISYYTYALVNEHVIQLLLDQLQLPHSIQMNYIGWGILGILTGSILSAFLKVQTNS